MRLKEWRLTHGWTQAQCADMFGVGYARTYQRYETGAILADAPFVLKAFELSGGLVTGHDVYLQRAEFLGAGTLPFREAAE